jgi:hypothetical protein
MQEERAGSMCAPDKHKNNTLPCARSSATRESCSPATRRDAGAGYLCPGGLVLPAFRAKEGSRGWLRGTRDASYSGVSPAHLGAVARLVALFRPVDVSVAPMRGIP